MGRAKHHATNVNEVVLAIAGGVIWRKDDEPLEAFFRKGQAKNVLWARIAVAGSPSLISMESKP